MRKHLPLIALMLMALIPVAYAIDVEGEIRFVDDGGNVTFAQDFTCTQINWVNGLTRFSGLIWGGASIGNLGFDVSAGDNMTVTALSTTTLTYNVTSGGAATSYVYFRGLGAPASVAGAVGDNYNPVNDILTVTTNGDAVVVVSWLATDVHTNIITTSGIMISIFTLLAIILIMASLAGDAVEVRMKLFYYLMVVTALMAIAYMLNNMGY